MTNNIRNFVIISHVDHGKSTLADRFLELTGTVSKSKMREQYLDRMDLERERGITIKMQPVRMVWRPKSIGNCKLKIENSSSEFILNLIDTPGHVDFSYEVSRALAAVEGAILLVDAVKGIQAQTLANYELAKQQGLVVIPVVNKIDLPNAKVQETVLELARLLGTSSEQVLLVSAKNGTHVENLLMEIIHKIPQPETDIDKPFRALIFDSTYDAYKGVVAFVRVVEGSIKTADKIFLMATKIGGVAKEIGFFAPELSPQNELCAGEIGYIATGIKEPDKVRIGDTMTLTKFLSLKSESPNNVKSQNPKLKNLEEIRSSRLEITPLAGYQEPKPVVFASFYPEDSDKYDQLRLALSRLKLQDPSFTFEPENREALGKGFRCGFLGTLHMEIIAERIRREFSAQFIISSPSVLYRIVDKQGNEHLISSPSDWLDHGAIAEIQEPWIRLEILVPAGLFGDITELLAAFSGKFGTTKYLGERIIFSYEMPLREMLRDFYDRLKSVTQGYGSMSYEILGWRKADLVKLEILIAGKKEEAFSQIISRKEAYFLGRERVERLKKLLPRQQFALALQARFEGRIIARETLPASRKDVTAPLYGGDFTRKRKLLEKQKRGKKELKQKGKIRVPPEVFLEMTKTC